MPYNRDIKYRAPFPTGALPTEEQLTRVISQANKNRADVLVRGVRRLFGTGR